MFFISDLESLTAGRIANLVIDMESRGEKVTIPVQQATETRTDKVMSEGRHYIKAVYK